jgi:hypothetical protein
MADDPVRKRTRRAAKRIERQQGSRDTGTQNCRCSSITRPDAARAPRTRLPRFAAASADVAR